MQKIILIIKLHIKIDWMFHPFSLNKEIFENVGILYKN